MRFTRHPINCIVPPHILRALAEHKDRRIRDIAIRSMMISSHMRGRREVMSRVALGAVAGEQRRTLFDAKHHRNLPGQLVRGEGAGASSDSAVNEAYDGLGATYALYQEVYHRNSIDDHGLRLDASVHYEKDFDNAFWDGRQMVFGDGDGIIFSGFTKAIDVIGHELTHGVTQFTAALDYEDQPGALNESFSDVFGSLVKQYHKSQDAHSADWLIGEGILAPGINGKALRSLKDPGTAYDDPKLGGKDPQPGDMSGYVEGGDVHVNSGIPNHAFFLLADQLGGNAWDEAGHIWYETLRQLFHNAQFQDCANITSQVAGQLFGAGSSQQQAVRTAWSEVGITIAVHGQRPRKEKAKGAMVSDQTVVKKQLQRIIEGLNEVVHELA